MPASPYAKLCPGCFANKGGSAVCPQCGYDETTPRGGLVLPHRTMLNNQYLIGCTLGKLGGFGITYLAWDLHLETPVAIKEYLPRELAGRDANQLTVTSTPGTSTPGTSTPPSNPPSGSCPYHGSSPRRGLVGLQ